MTRLLNCYYPCFYAIILGLGLTEEQAPQMTNFKESKELFSKIFKGKTRSEWCNIFDHVDACVAPVLTMEEAEKYPHNQSRNTFLKREDSSVFPRPAPSLSNMVCTSLPADPLVGEHTNEILKEIGYSPSEITKLKQNGIIDFPDVSSKL